LKKLILSLSLALAASSLTYAAVLTKTQVEAPQQFAVGGASLPAGEYQISLLSSDGVLKITNVETRSSVLVLGRKIDDLEATDQLSATFTPATGSLSLSQVRLPNGTVYSLPTAPATR
jgi:hypothetical protein